MRRQFGEDYYAAQDDDEQFVDKVKSGRIVDDDEDDQDYYNEYGKFYLIN